MPVIELYQMLGTLYIVATPIGNLEDITLRATRILKEVDIILAEDTRVTKKLLSSPKLKSQNSNFKLISYHQHSSGAKKLRILSELINGKNFALVSDAGTPGISDPGNELIDFLLENEPNIKIIPIPGPSAVTVALSICGFDASRFTFLGFLPKKKLAKSLNLISESKFTTVFFESPKRVLKTLEKLKIHIGSERRVFVGRELTKIHETAYRGQLKSVLNQLKSANLKGEVVVIVEKK